jgi:hypothetical protein
MSGVEPNVGAATKALEVLKDLPLWLLAGLAVAAGTLLWAPWFAAALPASFRAWVLIGGVVFGVLALARTGALLLEKIPAWRKARDGRRRFYLSAEPQQSFWSSAKQADDSIVTQVVVRFIAKNLTSEPLGLARARLIKPRIHGEIVHEDVGVRAVNSNIYGDAAHSGHVIPPRMSLPATASVMVRGVPWWEPEKQVRVKIGIIDDEGSEEILTLDLRVFSGKPAEPARPAIELVSSIANPVEKEVATVLQAEMSRYEKCGRRVGGLGSVHLAIEGREMAGVGSDSWSPNSPKNQSISEVPDTCDLRSDNLEALIAFYDRLTDPEKQQFAAALLARLDGRTYLPVSYFIVCVLWKIGKLKVALAKAKKDLPQGEIKVFGLSNVLMLLNGLLRYHHPNFTNDMLDDIERFLDGLNEHPFQIPEKLAAVRTARLLRPEGKAGHGNGGAVADGQRKLS